MNRIYHQQSGIDRLYIPRMKGEWRLLRISEFGIETEKQNLFLYLDLLSRLAKS